MAGTLKQILNSLKLPEEYDHNYVTDGIYTGRESVRSPAHVPKKQELYWKLLRIVLAYSFMQAILLKMKKEKTDIFISQETAFAWKPRWNRMRFM